MSSTVENDVKWEPLPPRKRIKAVTADVEESNSRNRMHVKQHQNILDNIEARINVVKAVSSLQSKDGSAGEFFEYLDHTADIQCHTWGPTLKDAFETMSSCMMNYMTDMTKVIVNPELTRELHAKGHDMQSLLFSYMDELLSEFAINGFCTVEAKITEFDVENFKITATLSGEFFDQTKHSSGTEIKAITYSNMQIHETPERSDLFVIVDI